MDKEEASDRKRDSRKDLRPNAIVRSPLFPEPVQVILTLPVGNDLKLIGTGLTSGRTYQPILSARATRHAANLPRAPALRRRRRLASASASRRMRLGLAYEYDPYFSLSIARVDPLPAPAGGRLRLLPEAPAHPLPAGRRPRRRQDDHGRAAAQGTEDPRPGQAHPDRRARQPDLPVAAGAEGQVPREVRGHRAATSCAPTTARTPGRNATRSSPRSPGSRASRTPARACCARRGT